MAAFPRLSLLLLTGSCRLQAPFLPFFQDVEMEWVLGWGRREEADSAGGHLGPLSLSFLGVLTEDGEGRLR